ncbi:MAG: ABC transporter substrate-binding protein [Lentisphaeria bacterium]|nr:ABC transporter substrate-binding protein [Lentisphaeria bacterium]
MRRYPAVCRVSAAAAAAAVAGLCGCRPDRASPAAAPSSVSSPVSLRVAVLPDLDSLPIRASAEDLAQGTGACRIVLVPAASAAERDQLLQAEKVDALVTDPVALALCNREGIRVRAVRHSMVPAAGHPQFRILAAPGSGRRTPRDLAGARIGVSEGTIVEFVVVRALDAAGVPPGQVNLVAVPSIAARMTLLVDGKLDAAAMPEPLATLAETRGAIPIGDSIDHTPFCCSVIAVRTAVLRDHPEAVRTWLRSLDDVARRFNADPGTWRAAAIEAGLLPPDAVPRFRFLPYPVGSVPEAAVYRAAAEWLRQCGVLADPPAYEDVVTEGFLPPRDD